MAIFYLSDSSINNYRKIKSLNESKDNKNRKFNIYGRANGENPKLKLDTSNLSNMKKDLIKIANKNKFTDYDYEIWCPSDYTKDQIDDKKSLLIGYCYVDEGDNYIVYSNKNDKFYLCGDGGDLNDLVEYSLKHIKEIIDEFQSRYF
jgi:hypothetical protein